MNISIPREKRASLALLALSLVAGALLCGLQWYYLTNQYDRAYQMYAHGSSAMTVLYGCIAATCALSLAFLFVKREFFLPAVTTEGTAQRSADLLCAVVTLVLAVFVLRDANASLLLRILIALLCLPCAFSFLAPILGRPAMQSATLLSRFALPLVLLLRLFYLYFDMTVPIEAPLKVWETLCTLALCLSAMMELREALGIPCLRLRQITVGLAVSMTALSALPQLLRYAVSGEALGVYTVFAVWEAALLLRLALQMVGSFLPKGKEQIFHYLLFGVLTTVVDFAVYTVLTRGLSMLDLIANLLAWVLSVAFAFYVNKFFVFGAKDCTPKILLYEIGCFVGARVLSFGIEELILWLGVYVLGGNDLVAKLIAAVIVIVLNYIASKFLIFKKKQAEAQPPSA